MARLNFVFQSLFWVACSRELPLQVELLAPSTPDPFFEVRTLRTSAWVDGQPILLREARWDQGPLDLGFVDPGVERLLVEGLDSAGFVRSTGASGPLDLLAEPPQGPLKLVFARVGVLSVVGLDVPRPGAVLVETTDSVARLGGPCPATPGERVGPSAAEVSATETIAIADAQALPLSDQTLWVGGTAGCPPTPLGLQLGPSVAPLPLGAAWAVVSNRVLVAGGVGTETEVYRFEFESVLRRLGSLSGPRVDATGVGLDTRLVLLGGRTGPQIADSAMVFDPSRGAALPELIPLGAPVWSPAAVRTQAGSIFVAGGQGPAGPETAVRALVVKSEADIPLGDATSVSTLPVGGPGQLLDLGGSLLFLPEQGAPTWITSIPRGAVAVPTPENVAGPFRGARLPDGTAVVWAADGTRMVFTAGLSPWLGPALRLSERPVPSGLIPRRPSAWTATARGLEGATSLELQGKVEPKEWVVFGPPRFDFEITLTLEPAPGGRAAILLGFDASGYDAVVLGGISTVERFPRQRLDCNAAETRSLTEPRPHRLRVERRAAEVRLDLDADGSYELTCRTLNPRAGQLGLGLVSGTVRFDGLEIR